jgi:hypothetical protein
MPEASPSAVPTHQPSPGSWPRLAPSVGLSNLISALICLAHELLATLHTLPRADIIRRFGTFDIKLIAARIKRALMLAEALDDRVTRTAKRIDNPPLPRLLPGKPGRKGGKRPRFNRDADNAALLAGLPTAKEIAAQISRRPIGAVIAEICRDLGIAPEDPLFSRILNAVLRYRGSVSALLDHLPAAPGKPRTQAPPVTEHRVPELAATGPP